ncbi:hypothetical protein ACJIZ3_009322 [Penstemon smallii]|uniref:Uncharacterized protein n=1 Tax=Penstemon smallii TaxID=265156 RepID=A0ABD3TD95_9LAMI
MAFWSAENATNAYLRAIKMGKREKEPDTAEFISALAAGTNARSMVVACANAADSTTLALVAAAHQTGGKVICILTNANEIQSSKEILGDENALKVKFVIGDAQSLLKSEYKEADFIAVDCSLKNCEEILTKSVGKNSMVLGYNAFLMGSWRSRGCDLHLLPIGEGLLVSRAATSAKNDENRLGKGSRWVVKVDKCTGEEHVFRVRN